MQSRSFKNFTAEWQYDDIKDCKEQKFEGVEVKFFENNKFQYSKFKNSYHTEKDEFMLLEWFEVDNKTIFLFNDKHGLISIFDAKTGDLIHQTEDNDVFIYDYKMFDDNKYLYISGWFWSPFPIRNIYHVPTMLTTTDYEPLSISCDDCESSYDKPLITLFGCQSCEEFINTHETIFDKLHQSEALKFFNKNRLEDILLKRFLESSDNVFFADDSKDVLMKILATDRTKFYIACYGGNTHEHLWTYDNSLFLKAAHKTLNQGSKEDSKLDQLSFLIASTLFNFIASLPIPEIHLHFAITSDVGNLNIRITHLLMEDTKFKSEMIEKGWTEKQIMQQLGTRYKINDTKPIQVEIFLTE